MYRYLVILAMLIALPVPVVRACSCVEFLTEPREALEKSSLVFVGRPLARKVVELPLVLQVVPNDEGGEPATIQSAVEKTLITFRVSRAWKGPGQDTYMVMTGGTWCEPRFEEGHEYVVFTAGMYAEANECAPTGEVSRESDVIEALDKLVPVEKRPIIESVDVRPN